MMMSTKQQGVHTLYAVRRAPTPHVKRKAMTRVG